jgi:hypothetical protein
MEDVVAREACRRQRLAVAVEQRAPLERPASAWIGEHQIAVRLRDRGLEQTFEFAGDLIGHRHAARRPRDFGVPNSPRT